MFVFALQFLHVHYYSMFIHKRITGNQALAMQLLSNAMMGGQGQSPAGEGASSNTGMAGTIFRNILHNILFLVTLYSLVLYLEIYYITFYF